MEVPNEVVGYGLSVLGTLACTGLGLKVYHRNGKNGRGRNSGCTLPLQKAHSAQIAGLETAVVAMEKAQEVAVTDMKADIRELRDDVKGIQRTVTKILTRLPQ